MTALISGVSLGSSSVLQEMVNYHKDEQMIYELPLVLRYEDLQKLIKISRSSLARWEAKSQFPRRIVLGKNSVGWCREQVMQWLQERVSKNTIMSQEI